jgi:hypothetical protein
VTFEASDNVAMQLSKDRLVIRTSTAETLFCDIIFVYLYQLLVSLASYLCCIPTAAKNLSMIN